MTSTNVSTKKEVKDRPKLNLNYERDKDAEVVRGIFHFYEVPGGVLQFVYKAYKQDEPITYTVEDGKVYSLPRGVARHLNKSGWYPIHTYMNDESGKAVAKVGQKVARYGFSSLEFFDTDDLIPEGKPLVTIEKV